MMRACKPLLSHWTSAQTPTRFLWRHQNGMQKYAIQIGPFVPCDQNIWFWLVTRYITTLLLLKPPGKPYGGKRKPKQTKKRFNCKNCGQNREPQKCPAYNQICHKCQTICINVPFKAKLVDECKLDDSEKGEFFITVLGTNSCKQKDWIQNVVINYLQLNITLDTGAQCNVFPVPQEVSGRKKRFYKDECTMLGLSEVGTHEKSL